MLGLRLINNFEPLKKGVTFDRARDIVEYILYHVPLMALSLEERPAILRILKSRAISRN